LPYKIRLPFVALSREAYGQHNPSIEPRFDEIMA